MFKNLTPPSINLLNLLTSKVSSGVGRCLGKRFEVKLGHGVGFFKKWHILPRDRFSENENFEKFQGRE
jgi:hypothetical protein